VDAKIFIVHLVDDALDLLDHFFRVLPQNEHNEIAGFTVFADQQPLQNGLATAS